MGNPLHLLLPHGAHAPSDVLLPLLIKRSSIQSFIMRRGLRMLSAQSSNLCNIAQLGYMIKIVIV